MESKQLLRAKRRSKGGQNRKLYVRGSEYASCKDTEENDDTGMKRRQKDDAVVKTLIAYIR